MSNRPNMKGESVVFDADALLAEIQSEAKLFSLGGEQFLLPVPTAWDDEVMDAANRNDLTTVGRLILGDDGYKRFRSVGGTSAFLQRVIAEVHGADLGESSASSPS